MKTILYTVVLISLIGQLSAQDYRKLDAFETINISGNVEVTLVQGDENSATIFTENGISPDDVTVYTKDNLLKIKLYETYLDDEEPVKIEVVYQKINTLRTSAGARVSHKGSMKVDTLELRSGSGSELELAVEAKFIEAIAAEGAVLTISGTTESQKVIANTGGQYMGLELECQDTEVSANTGGEAEVVARQRLDAHAHTGGSIDYTGTPERKNTRSFISAGISRIQ